MSVARLDSTLISIQESRASRYLAMMSAINSLFEKYKHTLKDDPKSLRRYEHILPVDEGLIKDLMAELGNDEMVVWFLRQWRFNLLTMLFDVVDSDKDNRTLDATDSFRDLRRKYEREYAAAREKAGLKKLETFQMGFFYDSAESVYKHLVHYRSLNIPEINNMVFGYYSFMEIHPMLMRAERLWTLKQSENERAIPRDKNIGEIILRFPNRWFWIDLETSECPVEAKAMRHCGNPGGSHFTILSLREPVDKGYKPHATFILDTRTNRLGEMKGFANEKPDESLHPYIVGLLSLPLIKGIDGGGYLPGNNFSLDDLSYGDEKILRKKKPELFD